MVRCPLFRCKAGYIVVIKFVAEAPGVVGTGIAFAAPFVISPPEVAQGEKVENFRIISVGFVAAAVCIGSWVGVIAEQRFSFPNEP